MIKNIIFDLGGVIVRLDKQACIESFRKLGFDNFGKILNEFVQDGFFLEYEKGLISSEEFRNHIRENINGTVSDKDIDNAIGDFLVGIPKSKLKTILRLKDRYNIFLLSNTNPIAIDVVRAFFDADGRKMEDYFHKMFLSYEMKLAKPDKRIFEKVLEIACIKAEETLFIDDSFANLESASNLGFNTLHVTQESDLDTKIASVI